MGIKLALHGEVYCVGVKKALASDCQALTISTIEMIDGIEVVMSLEDMINL